LSKLEVPGFYTALNARTERLAAGLRAALLESGVSANLNTVGSLLTLFFAEEPVRNYSGAKKSDTSRFAAFFREMLARGIFLPPSQFEALFVSAAHTDDDIDRTLSAARASLQAISAAQ